MDEQHVPIQNKELRRTEPQLPNIASDDVARLGALVGGGALVFAALRRAPGGLLITALGGSVLYRAVTGRWPLQAGPTTPAGQAAELKPVIRATTINRPASDLYRFWRDLSQLPQIMTNLVSVTETDQTHSRWVAQGPAGTEVSWDAEITEDQPDKLLAWTSLPDSTVTHIGRVTFTPAPGGRGTEVRVALRYRPPAGALGNLVAKVSGTDPGQQIAAALRLLKQQFETGQLSTTAGQPAARAVDPVEPPRQHRTADPVTAASDDSFPASDPPAWMAGNKETNE